MVSQVSLFAMVLLAVVMSGAVAVWSVCGSLVGLLVFSIICVEFWRMSVMSVPLWSSVFPYHVVECALMSPVIMLLVSVSRWFRQFVISVSSVGWSGSVVCLGGMYMFDRCK